jgi:hypothetical protein
MRDDRDPFKTVGSKVADWSTVTGAYKNHIARGWSADHGAAHTSPPN